MRPTLLQAAGEAGIAFMLFDYCQYITGIRRWVVFSVAVLSAIKSCLMFLMAFGVDVRL